MTSQVDSIIALSMLGVLGVLTLPMYALGVQMGSTHRHHLLPATISSELMAWSRRVRVLIPCACVSLDVVTWWSYGHALVMRNTS